MPAFLTIYKKNLMWTIVLNQLQWPFKKKKDLPNKTVCVYIFVKVQRGREETGVVCFLDPVLKRTSFVLSHLFSLTVFEPTSTSKPLACNEEEYSVHEIPTLLFVSYAATFVCPNLKRIY